MTLDGSGAVASPSTSQPNTPVTGLQVNVHVHVHDAAKGVVVHLV